MENVELLLDTLFPLHSCLQIQCKSVAPNVRNFPGVCVAVNSWSVTSE